MYLENQNNEHVNNPQNGSTMNQTENQSTNQTEMYQTRRQEQLTNPPKSKSNAGFGKLLLAAVLGSGLTVGATQLLDHQGITNNGVKEATITTSNTKTKKSDLTQMLESVSPSIVGVINMQKSNNIFDYFNADTKSNDPQESGTGSGVIYQVNNDHAYIVTNNHVVEGASQIKVKLANGKTVDADLVGKDALTDIAVLKINGQFNIKPMVFSNSNNIHTGDTVYAIGNPLGLEFSGSVTQGIISAKERDMTVKTSAGASKVKAIQTDAAINPGNSGGALINTNGELIGLNSMKIALTEVEGIGFAIPSNDVKTIIEQLVKDGKVVRPYMGLSLISMESVPEQYLEELKVKDHKGVLVADTDSYAGKSFKKYDIILKADGKEVQSDSDLRSYIYSEKKVGDVVKFTILRDGETKNVNLTLRSTNDQKTQ